MTPLPVYIGTDAREQEAYRVARASLVHHASGPILPLPLSTQRLREQGLYRRVEDARGPTRYCMASQANCATEFSNSRFFVPLLAHHGYALFVDCDVVFMRDVYDLLGSITPGKAVYVVQHQHSPSKSSKMDGQEQLRYYRKNWSSVMFFDCDHPANRRLNLDALNTMPGRDLHAFYWLNDSEIGELGPEWNFLVNEQPQPENVGILHFTNGGPWIEDWEPAPFDSLWLEAQRSY